MDVQKIHQLGLMSKISFEQGIDSVIIILEEELRKFS